MKRKTAKNRINAILSDTTKGLHRDAFWSPINNAWRALEAAGFDVILTGARYTHNADGNPDAKVWTFEIHGDSGTKPIYGICTAHGAGSIDNPLDAYDVSAYVS